MAKRLPIVAETCRKCGACCVSPYDSDRYVDLDEDDPARFSLLFRKHAVVGRSLRTKHDAAGNCVCVALRGTVGQRVSCSVYENRPRVCRAFRPGSGDCRQARRELSLE